jgi:hypothetical protein
VSDRIIATERKWSWPLTNNRRWNKNENGRQQGQQRSDSHEDSLSSVKRIFLPEIIGRHDVPEGATPANQAPRCWSSPDIAMWTGADLSVKNLELELNVSRP